MNPLPNLVFQMAIAEILKKEVQKTEVAQSGVTVHLSNLEAYVLVNYLYGVGGNPQTPDGEPSCRKIIDNIRLSMQDKIQGCITNTWQNLFRKDAFIRGLYFSDESMSIIKTKLQKLGLE